MLLLRLPAFQPAHQTFTVHAVSSLVVLPARAQAPASFRLCQHLALASQASIAHLSSPCQVSRHLRLLRNLQLTALLGDLMALAALAPEHHALTGTSHTPQQACPAAGAPASAPAARPAAADAAERSGGAGGACACCGRAVVRAGRRGRRPVPEAPGGVGAASGGPVRRNQGRGWRAERAAGALVLHAAVPDRARRAGARAGALAPTQMCPVPPKSVLATWAEGETCLLLMPLRLTGQPGTRAGARGFQELCLPQ